MHFSFTSFTTNLFITLLSATKVGCNLLNERYLITESEWDNRASIKRDLGAPDALVLTPELGPKDTSVTDGQALINRWLGRRASCNTGYYLCSGGTICCLSGYCCTDTNTCVKDAGGGCCAGGTCAAGDGCCAGLGCYPLTGQCCTTGLWCTEGNNCVLSNGVQKCCTDTSCTAYVSNGITVTVGPSSTSTKAATASTTIQPPSTTTASSPVSSPSSSGLALTDKIALGCGIGVGLPGTIATVWMCVRTLRKSR